MTPVDPNHSARPAAAPAPAPAPAAAAPAAPAPAGGNTRLIIDHVNISYKLATPHAFNEKVFLALAEERFQKQAGRVLAISSDGTMSEEDGIRTYKDSQLNFQPERGVVGVQGSDYRDVSEGFEFIVSVLKDKMSLDLAKARYLEMTARGRYEPAVPPLKALAGVYDPGFTRPARLLFGDSTVTPMTYRICSASALTDPLPFREMTNWYELRLEPMIANPNLFFWDLVFRQADSKSVLALWKTFPEKMAAMIAAVG